MSVLGESEIYVPTEIDEVACSSFSVRSFSKFYLAEDHRAVSE